MNIKSAHSVTYFFSLLKDKIWASLLEDTFLTLIPNVCYLLVNYSLKFQLLRLNPTSISVIKVKSEQIDFTTEMICHRKKLQAIYIQISEKLGVKMLSCIYKNRYTRSKQKQFICGSISCV